MQRCVKRKKGREQEIGNTSDLHSLFFVIFVVEKKHSHKNTETDINEPELSGDPQHLCVLCGRNLASGEKNATQRAQFPKIKLASFEFSRISYYRSRFATHGDSRNFGGCGLHLIHDLSADYSRYGAAGELPAFERGIA